MATGGGYTVINLWHDSTAADKAKEAEKEDEVVFVRKYDAKAHVQEALGKRMIIPSTEAEGLQNFLKIAIQLLRPVRDGIAIAPSAISQQSIQQLLLAIQLHSCAGPNKAMTDKELTDALDRRWVRKHSLNDGPTLVYSAGSQWQRVRNTSPKVGEFTIPYGGQERSLPHRRGNGGSGRGRDQDQNHGSLLVHNIMIIAGISIQQVIDEEKMSIVAPHSLDGAQN
ncbi:hypothetical protein Tco_1064866 [Tanacetum coccineum]